MLLVADHICYIDPKNWLQRKQMLSEFASQELGTVGGVRKRADLSGDGGAGDEVVFVEEEEPRR